MVTVNNVLQPWCLKPQLCHLVIFQFWSAMWASLSSSKISQAMCISCFLQHLETTHMPWLLDPSSIFNLEPGIKSSHHITTETLRILSPYFWPITPTFKTILSILSPYFWPLTPMFRASFDHIRSSRTIPEILPVLGSARYHPKLHLHSNFLFPT